MTKYAGFYLTIWPREYPYDTATLFYACHQLALPLPFDFPQFYFLSSVYK